MVPKKLKPFGYILEQIIGALVKEYSYVFKGC